MKNLLIVVFIALFAVSTHAAKIYVSQSASGAGSGVSWSSAFTNLQSALDGAQSGDTIWVAKGVYLPSKDATGSASPADDRTKSFALKPNMCLFGGFAGSEASISSRNITENTTVLSGDLGVSGSASDNSYHVVIGAANALIDGFTMSGGNANGAGDNAQSGAVFNNSGLKITNCVIANNSALFGGAMVVSGALTLQITGTRIFNNHSTYAGAAFDITTSTAAILFTNTFFMGNCSDNSSAIYNSGASPVFMNCVFDSNSTGAPRYGFYSEGGNPRFVNCDVYNDYFVCSAGPSDQMTLVNCIVAGNTTLTGPATVTSSCFTSYASGTGNIAGNPLFVNAQAGDFHLKAGSPCIDKADGSQAPALDYDGKPRFDYPKVSNADGFFADIGAFECATLNTPPIITGARVGGGFLDEAITIALDSLTVKDPDNIYPDDFGLIVGQSPDYAVLTLTPSLVQIEPIGSTSTTLVIPIRVRDLVDTSAAFIVTLPVKRRVAYVDSNATGFNNGSSWKNAFTNLKFALQVAPATSEIWVAKGTYFPVLSDTAKDRTSSFALAGGGPPLYGGFSGTETQKEQRNWRINETILSGDIGRKDDISDNCFHVLIGADSAILDGFVVTGGNADSVLDFTMTTYSTDDSCGGGMYNYMVSPKINNCTFRKNYALGGGAIYNFRDASPSITNCIFCYNYATETLTGSLTDRRGGGAIYNNWSCTPIITNCLFYRNSVSDSGSGAAIYHYWGDTMKVTNCTFFDNTGLKNQRTGFAVEWADAAVRNSIFLRTSVGDLDGRGRTVFSYTCLAPGDTTKGKGNIYVYPGFIDTASNDFHLKASSPCIDQAWGAYAFPLDIEGKKRYDLPAAANIDAAFVDMGAYEYAPATGVAFGKTPLHGAADYSLEVFTHAQAGPRVMITYTIPAFAQTGVFVDISLYDLKGARVVHLTPGRKMPGAYRISWGGASGYGLGFSGGFYLCRMQAGDIVMVKRFAVLR